MKRMKFYLVMAVAAMTIASCSNDVEVNSAENSGTPISLGTTIGYGQSATTRAAKNASYDYYHSSTDESLLQNNQFCGSAILGSTQKIFYSRVAVYVEESIGAGETPTNYAKPASYIPNGSGGLNPSTRQYYPNNDNDVKIYAYYPYGSFLNYETDEPSLPSWPTNERSGSIDFTVQDDQSNAVGYCISDLMYATTTVANANRTSAANLNFNHLLSKVVVKIKKANDTRAQLLNNASVSIANVKKTIAFNVADGTVPTTTASTEEPSNIKIMQMNSNAGTNDFPNASSENLGYAIIVPQIVNANTEFIKIALDWNSIGEIEDGGINNSVTEFVYKLPSAVTFEGGKVYTFTLTIDAEHPIVLSTSINDWTSEGTDPNGKIPN